MMQQLGVVFSLPVVHAFLQVPDRLEGDTSAAPPTPCLNVKTAENLKCKSHHLHLTSLISVAATAESRSVLIENFVLDFQ